MIFFILAYIKYIINILHYIVISFSFDFLSYMMYYCGK